MLGGGIPLGSAASAAMVASYNHSARKVDRYVDATLPALRSAWENYGMEEPDLSPYVPGMARHLGLEPDNHRIEGRSRSHKPPRALLGPTYKPFDRLLVTHLAAVTNPVWQLLFLWAHSEAQTCPGQLRTALARFADERALDGSRAERCFREHLERAATVTGSELAMAHPNAVYAKNRHDLQGAVNRIIAPANGSPL